MNLSVFINYILLWTFIGIFLFNIFVIYLFRSGTIYESRNAQGHLKKDMTIKGALTIIAFLVVIIAIIVTSNYFSIVNIGISLSYWQYFLVNFSLIITLVIYDTLVIDWWVIALWRPSWLKIPPLMDKEQMRIHVKRSLWVAPIISLLIAFASAGITKIIF